VVIVVASGKGGTGKTTVATNLAASSAEHQPVQFLDLDVEEPNAHVFLKPEISERTEVYTQVPSVDYGLCNLCGLCGDVCAFNALVPLTEEILFFPELCHSCGVCSYFCPKKAISEVEREVGVIEGAEIDNIVFAQGKLHIGEVAAPTVIQALKHRIMKNRLVIMDAPPGTSCSVVEAVRGADFCLLVTEPTPFGLSDLKLMVDLVGQLEIPAGIIINRYREGWDRIDCYAEERGIPVLMRIPFDREIAFCYAEGRLFTRSLPRYAGMFAGLVGKIEGLVIR